MCKLNNIILALIVFGCIILLSQLNLGSKLLENFQPGIYPTAVTKPILNSYQEKQNPQLSNLSYQEMSKAYPVFPANSLKNNNLEYWSLPNNGTCSPAEFCDAIYLPNPNAVNKMDTNIWNNDNNCSPRVNMW